MSGGISMIKVMVIEDEPEIRRLLKRIVEKQECFCVVAEAASFSEAVTEFSRYKPDVVFVDVDLNGESGLDCAKVIAELAPQTKIIFATAHSEYMANAFEIYAFDYLVKPFNMERVNRTLVKVRECMSGNKQESKADGMEEVAHSSKYKDKLLIKGKEQVVFVDTKDIIMVERENSQTNIITATEHYKTSVSLSDIEDKLNPEEFMRCHKSYIINLQAISRLEPYGRWTYVVKLKGTDATALMTSQNYEEIKRMFM